METFVPKAENDILAIIKRLEDEISQRKEALAHLHKAAEIIGLSADGAEKSQTVSLPPPSTTSFQIPVSARVDEFIDQLEPEYIFTLENVVNFVAESGLDITDRLRANISSALSRRKGKGVEGITRGLFKRIGASTLPQDAISYPIKQHGDASFSSPQREIINMEMSHEEDM
ncbi:hypothetical protein [Desulfovibrio desulfuricans]|uniref:hypothetical protein n=1 Tax=Desulfovibrio desulfuricans TaxID=876 RepID=UPI0035B402E8